MLDQPAWFDWLEQADYVYQCFKLKDKIGDMVKFSEQFPNEFETYVEVDQLRELV